MPPAAISDGGSCSREVALRLDGVALSSQVLRTRAWMVPLIGR